MISDPITLYVLSGILALIPAIIWLSILFRKAKRKGIQILIFFFSIFSVIPIFVLHYFLNIFPQFDILVFFQNQINDQNINLILLFISVGIVEEIIKQSLIRFVDKKFLLIQTINDSINYSLIAALGFAFAENIFYIFNIYVQLGIEQLIIAYLFRSIFTTTAHMIFSGMFGYYYGIAKFSLNIVEQEGWVGKKQRLSTFLGRIFHMSKIQAFKQITILKGLAIAIALHAIFNLLLQFNQIIYVAIYVVVGFILLQYKLSQKTGKLILITDISEKKASSMPEKDEDVVIELLGMWFNKKRYVDVIHICQRLLERDPDNKVVQLFKAQAIDKIGTTSAYGKILNNMFPEAGKKKKSIADMVIQKDTNQEEPGIGFFSNSKNSILDTPPDTKGEVEVLNHKKEEEEDNSSTYKIKI